METLHTYLIIQTIILIIAAMAIIWGAYKDGQLTKGQVFAFVGVAIIVILLLYLFADMIGFESVLYRQRMLELHNIK